MDHVGSSGVSEDNSVTSYLFDHFYELERNYPQHDPSLSFPEGRNGRYLYVTNWPWGVGWNNVFQILYLISHMAYLSNRALVFEQYTWHKGPETYVEHWGQRVRSRIPLSALVEGPIAGGPFPPEHPAPRAVSAEYFKSLFPDEKQKTRLRATEDMKEGTVIEVLEKYVSNLLAMPEGCVELEHPFNCFHFGDKTMLTVWPSLSKSPILRHFRWSSLVRSAVHANAYLVAPALAEEKVCVPGLMAVHIRRGDYAEHRKHLARWGSTYMGWCQSPGITSRFSVPSGCDGSTPTEDKLAIYDPHTWPSEERIVKRVREARVAWETGDTDVKPVRRLYIMTNGDRAWVDALKTRFVEEGDWDSVCSGRDLQLSAEQREVSVAVDMSIAERAAVFIGNGFSSLSANVVLMRRMHGIPTSSNHFW